MNRDDALDAVLVAGGLHVAAVAAVVLQAACTLQWLVVLFTIAALSIAATLVPTAVLLTIALVRPRLSSARPVAG